MAHALVPSLLALGLASGGLAFAAGLTLPAGPAQAQAEAPAPEANESQAQADALYAALGLPEMVAIMHEEGLAYGDQIAADLFGRDGGPEWQATVADIYDPARMDAALREGLAAALSEDAAGAIGDFFSSKTGRRIVGLEVSARRALLDEAVEEASKAAAAAEIAEGTPLAAQVARFVAANDLVETNVVGALNANYAFYRGLAGGGAFPGAMSEEEMLADVWSQEPQIRESTTEWVNSFLLMAYQPLTPEELESYIVFSSTPAGQRLNRALFTSFDALFEDISLALGLAASRYMAGQDI